MAARDPRRRREVAAMGGAATKNGRARLTHEQAVEAGRKGGLARHARRGPAPKPRPPKPPRQPPAWHALARQLRAEGTTLVAIAAVVGRTKQRVQQVLAREELCSLSPPTAGQEMTR